MKISRGKSQPKMVGAAFPIPCIVLNSQLLYQVLMTQVCKPLCPLLFSSGLSGSTGGAGAPEFDSPSRNMRLWVCLCFCGTPCFGVLKGTKRENHSFRVSPKNTAMLVSLFAAFLGYGVPHKARRPWPPWTLIRWGRPVW